MSEEWGPDIVVYFDLSTGLPPGASEIWCEDEQCLYYERLGGGHRHMVLAGGRLLAAYVPATDAICACGYRAIHDGFCARCLKGR